MADFLQVDCGQHGRAVAASVCGHVVHKPRFPLGFVENSDDPNNLQGWCFACEHVYLQEQDKTELFRAFCQHTVVCSACYGEIKQFHQFAISEGDA